MTVANWIAVIIPVLGLVGGAVLYVLQKSVDRQNEIKRERREVFRRAAVALETVYQSLRQRLPDEENQKKVISELEIVIAELQVTAPDTVVDAWLEIPEMALQMVRLQHLASDERDRDLPTAETTFIHARATALERMRRDIFGESKITLDRIYQAFLEVSTLTLELGYLKGTIEIAPRLRNVAARKVVDKEK